MNEKVILDAQMLSRHSALFDTITRVRLNCAQKLKTMDELTMSIIHHKLLWPDGDTENPTPDMLKFTERGIIALRECFRVAVDSTYADKVVNPYGWRKDDGTNRATVVKRYNYKPDIEGRFSFDLPIVAGATRPICLSLCLASSLIRYLVPRLLFADHGIVGWAKSQTIHKWEQPEFLPAPIKKENPDAPADKPATAQG